MLCVAPLDARGMRTKKTTAAHAGHPQPCHMCQAVAAQLGLTWLAACSFLDGSSRGYWVGRINGARLQVAS